MKLKKMTVCLFGAVLCLFQTVVNAAQVQTVQLTQENQIVYTQDEAAFRSAFEGMAPGDSRTAVIRIENKSDGKAAFFLSQKTTDALEEAGKSSGGAYEFIVEIGNDTQKTPLLEASAGGYSKEKGASMEGLAEIIELNDYRYITELEAGQSANLYVTLALDGEGMDSTKKVDYSNAVGSMEFWFRAYYPDAKQPVVITEYKTNQEPDTVITKIVSQIVPLSHGVKTGDTMLVSVGVLVLSGGILLLVAAWKKRKAGNER